MVGTRYRAASSIMLALFTTRKISGGMIAPTPCKPLLALKIASMSEML
jgi:hypothetical protein